MTLLEKWGWILSEEISSVMAAGLRAVDEVYCLLWC